MGALDQEARLVWRALRLLRAGRTAGDADAIAEARADLEDYAAITKVASIRERCTTALIADEHATAVVALPA